MRDPFYNDVTEAAKDLASLIAMQLEGEETYAIYGHSLGSLLPNTPTDAATLTLTRLPRYWFDKDTGARGEWYYYVREVDAASVGVFVDVYKRQPAAAHRAGRGRGGTAPPQGRAGSVRPHSAASPAPRTPPRPPRSAACRPPPPG